MKKTILVFSLGALVGTIVTYVLKEREIEKIRELFFYDDLEEDDEDEDGFFDEDLDGDDDEDVDVLKEAENVRY